MQGHTKVAAVALSPVGSHGVASRGPSPQRNLRRHPSSGSEGFAAAAAAGAGDAPVLGAAPGQGTPEQQASGVGDGATPGNPSSPQHGARDTTVGGAPVVPGMVGYGRSQARITGLNDEDRRKKEDAQAALRRNLGVCMCRKHGIA